VSAGERGVVGSTYRNLERRRIIVEQMVRTRRHRNLTHNLDLVRGCDRIIEVVDGRIQP
jgi:hypothetical protein